MSRPAVSVVLSPLKVEAIAVLSSKVSRWILVLLEKVPLRFFFWEMSEVLVASPASMTMSRPAVAVSAPEVLVTSAARAVRSPEVAVRVTAPALAMRVPISALLLL